LITENHVTFNLKFSDR